MSLDCRVRESIQEEAKVLLPAGFKRKSNRTNKMKHGRSKRKKRLIAGVLAAAL